MAMVALLCQITVNSLPKRWMLPILGITLGIFEMNGVYNACPDVDPTSTSKIHLFFFKLSRFHSLFEGIGMNPGYECYSI